MQRICDMNLPEKMKFGIFLGPFHFGPGEGYGVDSMVGQAGI